MRFKIAVLLPLLLSQLTNAQDITKPKPGSLAYLDSRYGFRDLEFEQPIETCKGMALVEDDGDLKFYTRKDESLELGGAKLKLVEYGFYKGKLANVTVNAEGKTNSVALLSYLEKYYGPGASRRGAPRNTTGSARRYWWTTWRTVTARNPVPGCGVDPCRPSEKLTGKRGPRRTLEAGEPKEILREDLGGQRGNRSHGDELAARPAVTPCQRPL